MLPSWNEWAKTSASDAAFATCHSKKARARPAALVPLMIRLGADGSSDVLRRSARCTRCGRKGAPKCFEVLKELRPQATRFGFLMNATNPATPYMRKHSVDGARTIGVELEVIELKELSELAAAFDRLGSLGVEGVAIAADHVFLSNPAGFAELALSHKLPSLGNDPKYAKAGGLISRSANYLAILPRCTRFVDEILKGAAPGDLAVELTVDYELTVNLKTARELGITIPPALLAQATEVLE
jgi:putative tryptophan/tyrosine transport system substrate-binding protein